MTTLLIIPLMACGICALLTPAARIVARRFGLVDRPDGRRKIHENAVPVAGGLAIFLAASSAVAIAVIANNPFRSQLRDEFASLLGLLLAAITICLVGVADDFWGLRGRHKLAGQLVAALCIVASGHVVRTIRLFDLQLDLGLLAVPFTIFWILGAINSLNLIDGMDGLSSCIGLIVSVSLAIMAAISEQWAAACIAVALAGALLGFLIYNLPPASIFLGDAGSMLIGLVVGVLAIQGSLKAPATIALAAPLAAMAIPIMDTLAAIIRRKLTGRSIYSADRGHLHHCLLRSGLTPQRALFWVVLFCLATCGGALASLAFNNELYAVLTAFAVVGTLIITRLFGFAEFLLVKERLLATGASFLHRNGHATPHQTSIRLQGSADWKDLWERLLNCAVQLQLKAIHLDVNAPNIHEGYHARWDCVEDPSDPDLWRAEIPLVANGQHVGRLQIVGQRNHVPVWTSITALAHSLEDLDEAVSAVAYAPHISLNTHATTTT